jgi:hypothetical protein
MDAVRFRCTGCGKTIRVSAAFAFRTGSCPGCGASFAVPDHASHCRRESDANSHHASGGGRQANLNSEGANLRFRRVLAGNLWLLWIVPITVFSVYWSTHRDAVNRPQSLPPRSAPGTVAAADPRTSREHGEQSAPDPNDPIVQLFKQGKYKDAVPRLDQLILQTRDDKTKANLYIMRAMAKMGSIGMHWSPDFLDDMKTAVRLDPQNETAVEFATIWYWFMLPGVSIVKTLVKSKNPSAADWAEAANAIRRLDQRGVDPEAIEGGRLLAEICERWASNVGQIENGDAFLRVLGGTLRGDPLTAIGNQIDKSVDISEANQRDLRRLGELEASLRRHYANSPWWAFVDLMKPDGKGQFW